MHAGICLESAIEEKCKINKSHLMFCMECMNDKLWIN